jgi:hypothetical protein
VKAEAAEKQAQEVQNQLKVTYKNDFQDTDTYGIRPTDLVPYLEEHESAPAKIANAEKKALCLDENKTPQKKDTTDVHRGRRGRKNKKGACQKEKQLAYL